MSDESDKAIRVTDGEWEAIQQGAKAMGVSTGRYLIRLHFKRDEKIAITQRERRETGRRLRELLRELKL